jgi:hypothetical protein
MKTLNLVVDNLFRSQLGRNIIYNVNTLKYNVNEDVVVFTVDQLPISATLNCAVMNVGELIGQEGLIVATSLKTANIIKSLPQPKENKLFYVWDLEWIRPYVQQNNAELFFELYNNKHYDLVARTEYHADILRDNFNCDVSMIIDDCNMEDFLKAIK